MAVFENSEKMYDVLGGLFRKLLTAPRFGDRFADSDLTIQFIITDPDGEIWVSKERKVICGNADLKPTIQMWLSGDTCHKFWLQQVSMPIALAKRLIRVKGPMPKVLKLLPLLKPAYEAYPDLAREHGIEI